MRISVLIPVVMFALLVTTPCAPAQENPGKLLHEAELLELAKGALE